MPTLDEAFGPRPPLTTEAACKMVVRSGATVAILMEGWSDQAALEALARRRGLDLPAERFVRRFMGTRARRKIRYGALLTHALDLRCVPRALDAVLAHARGSRRTTGK